MLENEEKFIKDFLLHVLVQMLYLVPEIREKIHTAVSVKLLVFIA